MRKIRARIWNLDQNPGFSYVNWCQNGWQESTGLFDKFEKEIFEGDKVICKSSMRPEGVKMTVEYEPCGRWNICNEGVKWLNDLSVEYTIIENIYEQN
jgi:hypothetical protein